MENSILDVIPEIPVADWMANFIDWLTDNLSWLFDALRDGGDAVMDSMTELLLVVPPIAFIIALTALAFFASGKKWGLPTFTVLGLIYIYNQGLWEPLMFTITLVIVASLLSIVIGVPVGILMAKSEIANFIITPILDFMQTMPAFVYLIPAVAFFGIGMVPGVFSAVIFALPPTVRFTNLGIRQVSDEMVEAAQSFGSTASQQLFKVELPLAKATIMAGINQTVLLALSMVVIASMIGAPGLGERVINALQRAQVGPGFVAGFALVVLAIILDRTLQGFNKE
ncbi:MAG: proline/glycine betaine ABC transporter permease [Alkalibacterium sp.]|uniref:Glycine betaine/proline transport system substrate-binding protein n=1 Tax=Alkalibacterium gilvum TaxID=1130080 RepID=A0A1H6TST8_9LACT|nr:proline/glycine betaine ABC transporter permease [Alkalibacterium sp.]SEI78772.1 glycine betaine/proline transport system substrate-binding protein [Alkalibacterium gilvum]MDN6293270.1 proline/glycine betaine ABC transporter permease [Alkalibacterium sp.]MDN6295032.1 proline/glycine betaine ABC transporter permease [Alkalibacterium sp.]MDN6326827.1 proline/glycine betaine ABC transporter permease [Alkalibacterium sp.]